MHRSMSPITLTLLIGLLSVWQAAALDNGLSRTPALGYNTWNYYGCDINETVIRSTADKLVELGLADLGFQYLNIDDCWHSHDRDANGRLQPAPERFPSGMAALGNYIHSKGLKFGIYSDGGLFTCAGYPGSLGHERVDAATWADWGVDYLKYDNCFAAQVDVVERYTAMRDALNATGRPILFSMCEWGVANPWRWAFEVGNSWRTTADISASWDSILANLDYGIVGLGEFGGPGGWNDPDILEVGNGNLPFTKQRAHFALWALAKSPLLIGTDLMQISSTTLQVLKAPEVIALNQDPLGVPGDLIWKEGPLEIYAATLYGDERGVVLFNRHWVNDPINITVHWDQLGFCEDDVASVRDLYAQEDLGIFRWSYTAAVYSGDVVALRVKEAISPSRKAPSGRCGAAANSGSKPMPSSGDWRPWHAPRLASGLPVCSREWDAVGTTSSSSPCAGSSSVLCAVRRAKHWAQQLWLMLPGTGSPPAAGSAASNANPKPIGSGSSTHGMQAAGIACAEPPVWWQGALEATARREANKQRFMQGRQRTGRARARGVQAARSMVTTVAEERGVRFPAQ